MQIQLRNQVSDLLRPFGKQRQYPAFKALFQISDSRPPHGDRPATEGQSSLLARQPVFDSRCDIPTLGPLCLDAHSCLGSQQLGHLLL